MKRRQAQSEAGRAKLQRICATLSALDRLAGRIGFLPAPLLVFVLSLLRPAEAAARAFALDLAADYSCLLTLPASPEPLNGTAAAQADHLAGCFRALAWIIGELAHFADACDAGDESTTNIANLTARLDRLACALRIKLGGPAVFKAVEARALSPPGWGRKQKPGLGLPSPWFLPERGLLELQ